MQVKILNNFYIPMDEKAIISGKTFEARVDSTGFYKITTEELAKQGIVLSTEKAKKDWAFSPYSCEEI